MLSAQTGHTQPATTPLQTEATASQATSGRDPVPRAIRLSDDSREAARGGRRAADTEGRLLLDRLARLLLGRRPVRETESMPPG